MKEKEAIDLKQQYPFLGTVLGIVEKSSYASIFNDIFK